MKGSGRLIAVSNHGLHHLHIRKRIYKHLEKYPHTNWFKRKLDYTMYGVAMLTPVVLLPQVYHLFAYKNAAGLSVETWFLLACFNVLWVLYGLAHREVPVYAANFFVAILNFAVVYGIILYR